MSASDKLSKGTKFLSVILGALVTGFMWRCRGEYYFGSSWGLFAVGTVLTLLIFLFYGNRQKMKFELIPLGAVMFGATVTGWGTVNTQMTGLLSSGVPFNGTDEIEFTEINPYSGLIMMLLMGFTLIPLFSFFVGTFFSKREYKFCHYVTALIVFFFVSFVMRASVSHFVLKAINSKAVDCFSLGLADTGNQFTPMQAYLHNFADISWAKHIPYGRNYFMCIENISNAFAALVVSLVLPAIFKDKLCCLVSLGINIFSAVSVTLSDAFLVIGYDTGLLGKVTSPSWLMGGSWCLWEFGTGFGMGFFIMLIIALLPNELTAASRFRSESLFENRTVRFIYDLIFSVFVFGVVPCRTFSMRIFGLFKDESEVANDKYAMLICAALATVFLICFFVTFRRNILRKNLPVPFRIKPVDFSVKTFGFYFLFCALVYFSSAFPIIKQSLFGEGSVLSEFARADRIGIPVMICSFVLSYPLYLISVKKLKRN